MFKIICPQCNYDIWSPKLHLPCNHTEQIVIKNTRVKEYKTLWEKQIDIQNYLIHAWKNFIEYFLLIPNIKVKNDAIILWYFFKAIERKNENRRWKCYDPPFFTDMYNLTIYIDYRRNDFFGNRFPRIVKRRKK